MITRNKIIALAAILLLMASCVSTKKYKKQVAKYDVLKADFDKAELELNLCRDERKQKAEKINSLETELAYVKSVSTTLLKQLNDLSILTNTQSESIKKSLENINSKESYIRNLQSEMARKDSLNLALVLSLKGALKDVNDEDIQIKVEGSAVMISISDKMLFRSGSYDLTPEARTVLGKVAAVIQSKPDIQFMVEGHTDNRPIRKGQIRDNWDLSVLRATSVVRSLQKDHGVAPERMIAAGRSEYIALTSNDTEDGKSLNRRTRIVILPQLDQFFKLIEPKQ